MKNVLQILLIFFVMVCHSQSIKELETELSYWKSNEKYGDKIKLARSLQKIDPFNKKAINYICDYYHDREIDSVNYFFENLAKKFPNNPEAFLLRSEFLHTQSRVGNYTLKKVEYLLEAKRIDPLNIDVNYSLSEIYYKDFILPYEKPKYNLFPEIKLNDDSIFIDKTESISRIKPKSSFPNAAELALQSFKNLWDVSNSHRNVIYYPMKQLSCFLNIELPNKFVLEKITHHYYPTNQFMNLPTNWECDLTIDYLFDAEDSEGTSSWLTHQLKNLNEPTLYNINSKSIIYRFTWLRSFHHPISIRIEKKDNVYNVYWSIGKGAGGYEPRGLKRKGKRKISSNDWQIFESLLNKANYKNLPNKEYVLMTDGASWTLEHKESDLFEAKNTNSPSKEFESLCLFLVKLANIKIKEDEIY